MSKLLYVVVVVVVVVHLKREDKDILVLPCVFNIVDFIVALFLQNVRRVVPSSDLSSCRGEQRAAWQFFRCSRSRGVVVQPAFSPKCLRRLHLAQANLLSALPNCVTQVQA